MKPSEPAIMSSGVIASYMLATRKSAYHDSCVPKGGAPAPEPAAQGKPAPSADYTDHVTQDVIWKQSVHTEKRCLKNWEGNWGFITEYDAKGQVKEKEELPEKSVMFSDDPNIPNTNSGNYGSRLGTQPAKQMQSLEHKFFSEGRRRKLPSDMICY